MIIKKDFASQGSVYIYIYICLWIVSWIFWNNKKMIFDNKFGWTKILLLPAY